MKTTLITKTLLVIALCGFAYADDDYTLDGTLEPEEIPGFSTNNEIDAPATFLPSVKAEVDENSLVRPGDEPIQPPQLLWTDSGQPIIRLVQHQAKKPANQSAPNTPSTELPQSYQNFNTMSEGERLATVKRLIETVLVANTKRGLNTRDNTPGDVLMMSLAYGADALVFQPNPHVDPRDKNAPKGNYVHSIGALCWNMPCNGKTILRTDGNKVIAKVGHGYQRQPAALAALMAMSNVMPNYELRVGGNAATIEHLIDSERRAVSKGANMSMALVALSFYGESKDQWKNELGEVWNIEKMLTGELNRSIDQGTSDVTDWLLGLTAVVKLYEGEKKPIRGPLALAKKQLTTYHDFVLSIQNDRYLWHPKFFLYKGFHPDAFETMYSGGHILRWLTYSLPDKELKDPRVLRAVNSLAITVNRVKPETLTNTLSAKQLEGLGVSLQALSLYYQRVFDDAPPVAQTSSSPSSAVAVR